MDIFHDVGLPMMSLVILLVPVGMLLLLVRSYRRKLGIWIALVLMPLAVVYPMLKP